MSAVDWDSPTWGSNAPHVTDSGSFLDAEPESDQ